MEADYLTFPNKQLRAEAIKDYIEGRYEGAVCFSCGNASRELKAAGVNTIDISPRGDLMANRWFRQAEVSDVFPTLFDATSGHLPMELMVNIASRFKRYLGELQGPCYYVPTGSGETLFCLKLAYPDKKFIAVYNMNEATQYDEENPFNEVVKAVADDIIFCIKLQAGELDGN